MTGTLLFMCLSYTHPSIFVFDCIVLCVECCLIGQVVFLADHGNDMGAKEMWKTESWIEKTHPFLTMVVPQALLDRIPGAQDTLTKNTQRLVRAVVMIHVGVWLYSLCNVQCSNPNMYNLGCRRCRAFVCLFFIFVLCCTFKHLLTFLRCFLNSDRSRCTTCIARFCRCAAWREEWKVRTGNKRWCRREHLKCGRTTGTGRTRSFTRKCPWEERATTHWCRKLSVNAAVRCWCTVTLQEYNTKMVNKKVHVPG